MDEADDILLNAERDLFRMRRANERQTEQLRETRRNLEVIRRRVNTVAYRVMEQKECDISMQIPEKKGSRSVGHDDG